MHGFGGRRTRARPRVRSGTGRQGVNHSRSLRRARTSRHSRGRSATERHAGDVHDQERLRASRQGDGMTWEQWQQMLASRTHGKRLMTLEEMANVAAFMASDKASGMTGTTVNLTMGRGDDLGLGEGRALSAPPPSAQA